ncbi:DUF2927 domain-containing protein [Celeribacter marinus]|uniref:DUF2927 domain-containing protein n=1 Tax=Celeribacter marinus TaxID=1397108 RepID=UPI003F6A69AA
MWRGGHITSLSAGAIALALSACVTTTPPQSTPAPRANPTQFTPTVPQTEPVARSTASLDMMRYYAKVQADLLRNELLRTDAGGADTPFGARQLAENFDAIALNDEYTDVGGQYVARTTRSTLHKWTVPVRLGLEFGASVPPAQRTKDQATLTALAAQLGRATGHSVAVSARPNFHVLVLNEDERRAAGPRLAQLIPGLPSAAVRSVENMPPSAYCLVIASDPADDGAYRSAVAVIRGEHPDLMRASCFHEEIAQGLGLANDSPHARPSIFNDDEEFALLTRHDELLLRILYDPRLTAGMQPDTARAIAAQIARELMGDPL